MSELRAIEAAALVAFRHLRAAGLVTAGGQNAEPASDAARAHVWAEMWHDAGRDSASLLAAARQHAATSRWWPSVSDLLAIAGAGRAIDGEADIALAYARARRDRPAPTDGDHWHLGQLVALPERPARIVGALCLAALPSVPPMPLDASWLALQRATDAGRRAERLTWVGRVHARARAILDALADARAECDDTFIRTPGGVVPCPTGAAAEIEARRVAAEHALRVGPPSLADHIERAPPYLPGMDPRRDPWVWDGPGPAHLVDAAAASAGGWGRLPGILDEGPEVGAYAAAWRRGWDYAARAAVAQRGAAELTRQRRPGESTRALGMDDFAGLDVARMLAERRRAHG